MTHIGSRFIFIRWISIRWISIRWIGIWWFGVRRFGVRRFGIRWFGVRWFGFCICYNSAIRAYFIVDRNSDCDVTDEEVVSDNCCTTIV